jgi:hypothetical protein
MSVLRGREKSRSGGSAHKRHLHRKKLDHSFFSPVTHGFLALIYHSSLPDNYKPLSAKYIYSFQNRAGTINRSTMSDRYRIPQLDSQSRTSMASDEMNNDNNLPILFSRPIQNIVSDPGGALSNFRVPMNTISFTPSSSNNTNTPRIPTSERRIPSLNSQNNSSRNATAAATAPAQRAPLRPITTVAPLLPKITYDDDEDGTKKTLEYIQTQIKLLQWLGSHPWDSLSAHQACEWTQMVAPDSRPSAKDAVRLCYYMRSQGFETYAQFHQGIMSLYVANQQTHIRGPHTDMLYWKQDVTTNYMHSAACPLPRRSNDGAVTAAAIVREQTQDNGLALLVAAAEETLQNLLVSENPDPV